MKSEKIGEQGFSLIEVMISITLLTVVVVPVFRLFAQNVRILKQLADWEKAVFIAQRTMEEIKAVNSSEIELLAQTLTGVLTADGKPELGLTSNQIYKREVIVGTEPGLINIKILVSWEEGRFSYFLETKVVE